MGRLRDRTTTLRRFLVVQSLMLWQGGFLFYALVVVPTGNDVLGNFPQGRVTRHVTDWLNVVGAVSLAVMAWENAASRWRWLLWGVMAAGLIALVWLHPRIESYVDWSSDGQVESWRPFYAAHRAYLIVSAVQWGAAMLWTWLTIRTWRHAERGSPRRG